MKSICSISVVLILIKSVECTGIFEIRLNKYETDGKLVTGRQCDFVSRSCDIFMQICISNGTNECLFKVEEQISMDLDVVIFNYEQTYGQIKNPISISVEDLSVSDEVFIFIKSFDYDDSHFFQNYGELQLIDEFQFRLSVREQNVTKFMYVEGSANIKPTRLNVSYILTCDVDYFGGLCGKFCNETLAYICQIVFNESVFEMCSLAPQSNNSCRKVCINDCNESVHMKLDEAEDPGWWHRLTNDIFWQLVCLGVFIVVIVTSTGLVLLFFHRSHVFIVNNK